MTNFTELTSRYVELTRSRPDRRWKESTLAEKVAEVEAQNAEDARQRAEREAEKAAAEATREARVAARGAFETYHERAPRGGFQDEYRLGNVTYWASRVIAKHEEVTAELTKAFLSNPLQAMSWGGKYFDYAGELQVAYRVMHMFEYGTTPAGILDTALGQVIRAAKSPARSTSPTSNLAEVAENTAWAKVVDFLNGGSNY